MPRCRPIACASWANRRDGACRHAPRGARRRRACRRRVDAASRRPMSLAALAEGAPICTTKRSRTCASMPLGAMPPHRVAFSRATHVVRLERGCIDHRRADGGLARRCPPGSRERSYTLSTWRRRARTDARRAWPARSASPKRGARDPARDVGGNFGTRNSCYAESVLSRGRRDALTPVKARRPSRGVPLRYHGRDLAVQPELSLDPRRPVPRISHAPHQQPGAHQAVHFGPLNRAWRFPTTVYACPPRRCVGCFPSSRTHRHALSKLGSSRGDVRHRGADRPRGTASSLRSPRAPQKNLVPARAMPYTNAVGVVYTRRLRGGLRSRDRARRLAGFENRRAEARRRVAIAGSAGSNYTSRSHRFPPSARNVTVRPEGQVDLVLGTLSSGLARDELRAAARRVAGVAHSQCA